MNTTTIVVREPRISLTTLSLLIDKMTEDFQSLSQFGENLRLRYIESADLGDIIQADQQTGLSIPEIIDELQLQFRGTAVDQSESWKKAVTTCLKVLSMNTTAGSSSGQAKMLRKRHSTPNDACSTKSRRIETTPRQIGEFAKIPAEVDYQILLDYFENSPSLYGHINQSHIVCRNSGCQFCRSMFLNTKLTRCDVYNHPDCIKGTKFYPHVGLTLWSKLRSAHDRGDEYRCLEKSDDIVGRYTLARYQGKISTLSQVEVLQRATTHGGKPSLLLETAGSISPIYRAESPILQ